MKNVFTGQRMIPIWKWPYNSLLSVLNKVKTQIHCDMVKHELRVTSCELQVESLKARIRSLKAQVKLQNCEFQCTSYELKSTSCKFKFTSSRIIKSMKTQVNSL